MLCDEPAVDNLSIDPQYHFIKYSGVIDDIVGFAFNGVPFFSGTSELNYDAFFPKSYTGYASPLKVTTDICLGST